MTSQLNTMHPSYVLQDVPGKGKGIVATEKIPKGTRVLSEKPIITVPADKSTMKWLQAHIKRQVSALSADQRQSLLSMHNIHGYENDAEQYLGIFRTNGLPIESNGIKSGIFLEACRINHACNNNAQKSWNSNINRHTIHALRDIQKGEEITINYLFINENRKTRQETLQAKFKFACLCQLCSLPPEKSDESDKRLQDILNLDRMIGLRGLPGILSSPLQNLRYVDRLVQLYNEQGPDDAGLPRAFFDAAQIAIAHGDLARGRTFAARAVLGWRNALGSDSPEVIQYDLLTQNPESHELYGTSMDWESKVDDVPHELQPQAFEDWLWKRVKIIQGQLANLRDRVTFPAFHDLPHERIANLDFYEYSSTQGRRLRRHWCFLSEIVDIYALTRLSMMIKDISGREMPLHFYTDGRGRELPPSLMQKGYTIAILYAEKHDFAFDEPGIRHEDPALLKIFPISLDDLLKLNDEIHSFMVKSEGSSKCHGCGTQAARLKCGKCSTFWYCNKACQAVGWNEKGHKNTCKLLRDHDLQGLFLVKWGTFNAHVQFPLNLGAITSSTLSKDTEKPKQMISGKIEAVDSVHKLYSTRTIPGKGNGLVATMRIAKGTRILSEAPAFKVPRDNPDIKALEEIVEAEIRKLNDEQRQAFLNLTNVYGKAYSRSLGIARTNVLPLGSNARSGGLFLEASCINHSCRQNAQNTWNENLKCITIHALRDIEADEEITISYLATTPEYAKRKQLLNEKFKFECKCELCSLPVSQRGSSDNRLGQLELWDTLIGRCLWEEVGPGTMLPIVHQMLELFDEEGIWDARIARAYQDAYEIAMADKDETRARVFAERAYSARRLIEGEDSPVTIAKKRNAERLSARAPQGMNPSEFENWLWMLEQGSDSDDY